MVDLARWGIDTGYHDIGGVWREAPPSTLDAITQVMNADAADPYDDPVPLQTLRLDHSLPILPPGVLHLEGGGELRTGGELPPDLPLGYHRLVPDDDAPRTLALSPGRCPVPPARRWGISAQVYATRSAASWGIGDLGDLATLGEWGAKLGASATLINPMHAAPPGDHQQPSPYSASSRCFANPLYLRVEDVPGAERLAGLAELAAAGRALNAGGRVDRDAVWQLKSAALEQIFTAFDQKRKGKKEKEKGKGKAARSKAEHSEFARYVEERGAALEGFARFNALAELHGLPWQQWPESVRRPDAPAVASWAATRDGARRIRYHQWLQWLIDRQLAAAGSTELIVDLAIGVDAGGADAWWWQDAFAGDVRVGAPPDEFNTLGQDWGLPPLDPWRLRRAGYEPFIEAVRANLRRSGGLRFDHVMGLFRLYWIPLGASPAQGTYVRYPYWDLLNLLALEAERAGAYVIGEDLGTVEDHVRHELAERRVLSYKLLWFESDRPAAWRRDAVGAVTTHDLPTVAGVWTGRDLQAQRDLDLHPNEESAAGLRRKLQEWTGVAGDASVAEVVEAAYGLLAEAPCEILIVGLDDLAGAAERPNIPGTVDEQRPNWSIPLPLAIEELQQSPLAQAVAARMAAVTTTASPGDQDP